jgi:hypothetical protein
MTRTEYLDYVAAQILTGVANNVSAAKLRNALTELALSSAFVKADLGLGNVDNTSDLNKPVSTAQVTALAGKVDKVAGKRHYVGLPDRARDLAGPSPRRLLDRGPSAVAVAAYLPRRRGQPRSVPAV